MEVSVVVPVYNVEDYIERCLDSIINQNFKHIEIIAINDGSTDSSLSILKHYSCKDKRIRIIDSSNKGVSNARNLGVREARGDFIVFVDSDDWIDKDMIKKMYTYLKKEKADLVMCTYVREFKNRSKEKIFDLPNVCIYGENDIKDKLLRKLVGPIGNELSNPEYLDALGTVWGKMYRSEILKNNDFRFVDLKYIGSGEDTLFNIYAFNKFKRVVIINEPMYHYWKDNPNSITTGSISNFLEKRKNYFTIIRSFINENKLGDEFHKALDNRICTSVLGMGLLECSRANDIPGKKKIKNIKRILKEDYIQEAYSNLELKHFAIHWKVFYMFNKYKMSVPSYLMLNTIDILRKTV